MDIVKRLFFHGHNDEDQEKVVVPWAHCWLRRTKKGSLYHGHSDNQAKVTDCTMGTVLIEEDQESITVPWAHCWGTSTYMHWDQKGWNPLIVLFYTEGRVKVSIPWAHCWDPRKCHHTMGTALRAKQRLLIVPWAQCWLRRTKKVSLYHENIVEGQAPICTGTNRAETH